MIWDEFIQVEMAKDYFKSLSKFLSDDAKSHTILPPKSNIFNAFNLCPLDKIRCVILGQDVYHGPNQAMGLAFSVHQKVPIPPSLQNIFKELQNDIGAPLPKSGDLTPWAAQGVFLLNTALTVRQGQPGSHLNVWRPFTDATISAVNGLDRPVVFVLLGNHAKEKRNLITNEKHLVLTGTHPSPLGANKGGFFGGKYFSRTNDFLTANDIEPIDWILQ